MMLPHLDPIPMKIRTLLIVPLVPLLGTCAYGTSLVLTGSAGDLLVSPTLATAVTGEAFADALSYAATPAAAFTVSVIANVAPGAITLANAGATATRIIILAGGSTVIGTTDTKTGAGYFNSLMSFSGGIATGSGFTTTLRMPGLVSSANLDPVFDFQR